MNTPSQFSAGTPTGFNPDGSAFQTKKQRGCFFYGCLTVIVLGLIVTIGGYFGVKHFIGNLTEQYTAPAPMAIPTVTLDASHAQQLKARFDEFITGMKNNTGPKQLALTDQELNAVINFDPNFVKLKGHAYFSFDNDQIAAKLSMPLDDFGVPGRYLNGDGVIALTMKGGVLEVYLKSLTVNGSPVSETILQGFSQQNLAAEMYKDPDTMKLLQTLESIQVKDHQLVVIRK